MKNVLVTGITGFVGYRLGQELHKRGYNVVGIVRDVHKNQKLDFADIVYGNIIKTDLVQRTVVDYDIDTIFHLAAQSIVSRAEKNPVETFKINAIGTVNVLEVCRKFNIKCLFTSTDKVYGPTIKATEQSPLIPTNVYATSKIAADLTAQMYMKNYSSQVIITRACNIYGPGDTNPRIIPNTIRACLEGKSPIIFTDIVGEREYIYVDDVVDAYITLAEKQRHGIFNIGTGFVKRQTEVVFAILKYFEGIKPEYVRKGGVELIPSQSLDSTRIHTLVGWHHKVSFAEGIKRTVEWWRKAKSITSDD